MYVLTIIIKEYKGMSWRGSGEAMGRTEKMGTEEYANTVLAIKILKNKTFK